MKLGLLTIILVLTTSCATRRITKQELNSINKVAVLNQIDNTLNISSTGLTLFGNTAEKIDIEKWGLAKLVTEEVIKNSRKHLPKAKFKNIKNIFPYSSIGGFDENLNNEIFADFDTALLISKAGIVGTASDNDRVRDSKGGFILYGRSAFGATAYNLVCVRYNISLFNIATKEIIAISKNIRGCPKIDIDIKEYANYENAEIKLIKKKLIADANKTIPGSVETLFNLKTH